MEYANDEIFKIKYNTRVDRLQMKHESWTSRFYKKIKEHKFLSMIVLAFFLFSSINVIIITNFMKLLQNF